MCTLYFVCSFCSPQELDEAIVVRLADSCLAPVFGATAAAPFAARAVVALFERHEGLQSGLLESVLARQWPLELRPSFRLLPPGRGLVHQSSVLVLQLLRAPEHCAAAVSALFAPQLRPALASLLADAAAALGLLPNAAPLLLAASNLCARHATADPWALEALGGIVAAVAQVTSPPPPGEPRECAACSNEAAGPVFRVQCGRCKLHFHGACVSATDERVQMLKKEEEMEEQEWTCRACRVRQHPLSETAPSFVRVILAALHEKRPKVRARALRCLQAVLQVRPALLERADVAAAVRGRFFDQSVSVRDAAVELAGACAPVLFFAEIADRALDTGLSVRKRVVRVLSRVAQEASASPQRRAALATLAGRLGDEKSVKILAREAFERAWFSELPCSPDRAAEMAAVVRSANGAVWFVPLVRKLAKHAEEAAAAATGKRAATTVSVTAVCEALSDALVAQGTAEALGLLRLLADIVPSHLAGHLHALRAQLDRATADVVGIIERVMAHSVDHEFEQLQELEVEMVRLVYNHAETGVVAGAVRCLAGAVEVTRHARIMCDLYAKVYGFLFQCHAAGQAGQLAEARHPALIRALFTLGSLLRWFDFDACPEVPATLSTPVHAVAKGELHVRVLQLCLFFAGSNLPLAIRSRATEAAGNLSARSSAFLLMSSDLLRATLAPEQPAPELLARGLTFVLQHVQEERRLYQERARKGRGVDEPVAEEAEEDFYDGTASVSATVVNEHLAAVLRLTGSGDAAVRGAALALVAEALAQGLVQGGACVANLMALLTDEPARAEAALAVLVGRAARSKGFLEQMVEQLGPGVAAALALAKRLSSDKWLRSAERLLAGLFRAVRDQVRTRNLFLTQLVTCWETAVAEGAAVDVDRLLFLATAMAHLPFASEQGPLLVCHHMNRLVALHAHSVPGCGEEDDGEELEEESSPLGRALSLALQLKLHLKTTYKISDAKLQSFLAHKPGPESKSGSEMAAVLKAPEFDPSVPLQRMLDTSNDFNVEAMVHRRGRRRAPTGKSKRTTTRGKRGATKKKRAVKEEFEEEEDLEEEEDDQEEQLRVAAALGDDDE
jgi:hypothetical protein